MRMKDGTPPPIAAQPPRRGRVGRPAKPLITPEETVRVSIALIEQDGLEALTVHAVARAMGVTAPSLYYHYRDKDALLSDVALTLLREVRAPEDVAGDWEKRVIALGMSTRRVITTHPKSAPLMLRFFPRRLMLGAYEKTLIDCPYPREVQFAILEGLEKLCYGSALFAASAIAFDNPSMPAFPEGKYPTLKEAIDASPFDEDALYLESLHALLDGFRARYGQKDTTS